MKDYNYQAQLEESEALCNVALEFSKITYWLYDVENNVATFGSLAQKQLKLKSPVLEHMPDSWFELGYMPKEYYSDYVRVLDEIRDGADSASLDISLYHPSDGQVTWHRVTYTVIARNEGKPMKAIGISNDITEQKRHSRELEEALARARTANHAKSDFLARMSHDIRTPLNGIIGMLELARENDNPKDTVECLEKMKTSSEFLLSLINDILDLSKVESGKVILHQEPYSRTEFHRYLESVIRPMCRQKNIELELEITDTLKGKCPCVDKLRVNQIFFNIVSNAVKFTAEKGQVLIRVWCEKEEGGRIRLCGTVADTGIGMSEEFQKHMFDSFTQEEQTLLPQRQGTGLGLAIVKNMMDLMGGHVTCVSELGKGSLFTISAEVDIIEVSEESTEQLLEASAQDQEILRNRHILLVEDHPLNQEIARRLLEKKYMIITLAENGQEAVDLFQKSGEHYYDAIMMDIRMPVMDGLTATRRIRSLPRTDAAAVPIIAMTANAFDEDREESRKAGMNDHISKPILPRQLYKTLMKQLVRVY